MNSTRIKTTDKILMIEARIGIIRNLMYSRYQKFIFHFIFGQILIIFNTKFIYLVIYNS